jgi:hypothetical protein
MTPEQLTAAVEAFIADAKEKASGGLTVAEFGSLVIALLRLAVAGLDTMAGDGQDKKLWAVQMIGVLFDAVAFACVPWLATPAWLVLRPAIRSIVLAAAGGMIESLLPIVRKAAIA